MKPLSSGSITGWLLQISKVMLLAEGGFRLLPALSSLFTDYEVMVFELIIVYNNNVKINFV
jgi:hypothetical protein